MSQPHASQIIKTKTKVFSLKFNDQDDNIELVPLDGEDEDGDESNSQSAEEAEISKNNSEVVEVIEHICGMCNRSYASIYSLKNHMRNCKPNAKLMDENYVEYTLEEIETMQKSIRGLVDRNICYCCGENLDTAHSGHIRCQDCFKSFKNVTSYRRHASFIHSSLPNSLPCKICNAKCPTRTILTVHLEAHAKGKSFACRNCGKDFTRKYHLIRHEQYSNCDPSKQKDPHKCNVCGKTFFRLDNLRQHLRQHISDQPKNRDYICPFCEKSFVGTTILNVHIRTHTGERPFPCDICSRGFPSNGALRKHRRSHTGEKPFKCEVCARAFAAKEVLNRHMKTHTGVRPYVCNVCGKGFIQGTQLRTHMFNHTGENGYKCIKCDFQFNRKFSLNTHRKDFHCNDDKILDCKMCEIIYEDKTDLAAHLEQVHKGKLYKCRACKQKFIESKNHPECADCKYCKFPIEKQLIEHEHVPIKTMSISVKRAVSMSDNDQEDPESSIEPGMPRKLKILTSKPKPHTKKNMPASENTRVTRSQKNATKDNLEIIPKQPNTPKGKRQSPNKRSINQPIEIESIVKVEQPDIAEPGRMDDDTLKECAGQLLNLLLDADLLAGFGWPTASIEHVLSSVIRQCGHEPVDYDSCLDYSTKIRENIKLLCTVVVENESFKELLNNHTIDQVVLQILKLTSN